MRRIRSQQHPRDHHRQPTTRQAVAITARPAMDRHPVPGRRMGHHRLVGHGAPALAPAARPSAGNSAAPLSPPPRATHRRHGWSCCRKSRFWQRFSAIPNGAARVPAASYYRHRQFYLHVANRLGLPSGFAASVHVSADPLAQLGRAKPGPTPQDRQRSLAPSNPSQGEHSMSCSAPPPATWAPPRPLTQTRNSPPAMRRNDDAAEPPPPSAHR